MLVKKHRHVVNENMVRPLSLFLRESIFAKSGNSETNFEQFCYRNSSLKSEKKQFRLDLLILAKNINFWHFGGTFPQS